VLAAEAAGTWGLKPHLLIVDEFAQWPTTPEARRFWSALYSALPKVATSRVVILTSAGDPAHPAGQLIARARESDRWYVDEIPGPCPWISAEDLEEQRAELTESQYARLHLNRWCTAEDRLTTVDDVRACVTLDGPQQPESGRSHAVGLDVGLVNDRTVLTVAHAERREGSSSALRVVLDRQFVWQGSRAAPVSLDAVEAVCREVHRQYGRPHFIADPYQATQLCQRLRDRGFSVEEYTFTQTSISRLAQRLYLLLRHRALALPPDEDLLDELAKVRLRETSPAIYRMDHDPGRPTTAR
jgi:phage terminase large subunit-like protein